MVASLHQKEKLGNRKHALSEWAIWLQRGEEEEERKKVASHSHTA